MKKKKKGRKCVSNNQKPDLDLDFIILRGKSKTAGGNIDALIKTRADYIIP